MYDILTYIGRFQPFHLGHKSVIDKALELSNEVVVIVGSSYTSRSLRNPFTFEERKRMIQSCYPNNSKLKVLPVEDFTYNDEEWLNEVQKLVQTRTSWYDNPKIGLIGHSKDSSSYYLKMFPQWKSEDAPNYKNLSATEIRNSLLRGVWDTQYLNTRVPASSLREIKHILQEVGESLFEEWRVVQQYKSSWAVAPYPPTFVTVDAVVVQAGHILLVKRKAAPGRGFWALPGGFVNQTETLLDASIRELREETRLKVPSAVLKGSIKQQHTFDNPYRSVRGRTITTAFFFDLSLDYKLPQVKGSDDAEEAKWVPFSEVDSTLMFEDHYSIINYFIKL